MLDRIRICGILETLQHPELFVMLLGFIPEQLSVVCQSILSCWGGGTDIREYFCHDGVYLVLVLGGVCQMASI